MLFFFCSLEIHLSKVEHCSWATLVIGDDRGQMVLTEEQIAQANEQLDKFTSSVEVLSLVLMA